MTNVNPQIIYDLIDAKRRVICNKQTTDGVERMYWEGQRVAYTDMQEFIRQLAEIGK